MRAVTVLSQLLPTSGIPSSLVYNTTDMLLQARMDDAFEFPTGMPVEVGHPDGTVDVPGKRSWIYIQRKSPDGDPPVVLEMYAPSGKSGKTRVKFEKGMVLMPRRSGTVPTYWYYDGMPPSAVLKKTTQECTGKWGDTLGMGSLAGVSGFGAVANGSYCVIPASQFDLTKWPPLFIGPTPDPSSPSKPKEPGFNVEADSGLNDLDPKLIPQPSTDAPSGPMDKDLWYDGTFVRRFTKIGTLSGDFQAHWDIVQGPTAGNFADYFVGEDMPAFSVVYLGTEAQNVLLHKAGSDNPASRGRVIGLVVQDAVANEYRPVQTSGYVRWTNTFGYGKPLYLGTNGQLTDTPPLSGSGQYVQRIGYVIDGHAFQIDIGPAIKRV